MRGNARYRSNWRTILRYGLSLSRHPRRIVWPVLLLALAAGAFGRFSPVGAAAADAPAPRAAAGPVFFNTVVELAAGQMCNWGGTWKGTDGDQSLTMTVDPHTGVGSVGGRWAGWTSSDATTTSFSGTVSGAGMHLDNGTWFNGTHGGTIDYTMGSDCNSFSGQRYECYKGSGTGSQTGQGHQDPPHFCSSGSYSPMQISYQRSGGSSTVPIPSAGAATSSSAGTGGSSGGTTTTSGTPICTTTSVGVAPPPGCPATAASVPTTSQPPQQCMYGGQSSAGFPCVSCAGGGTAVYLSECPQAQTCGTGITYAPTGCIQCPGGTTAATVAQCPQSVSCDLGGLVYPPASCVPCPGSTQTAVSPAACPAAQLPCSDGTASDTQCNTCTDSTTTANTCKSCTDGSTTALTCKSCTDGTTTTNTCTSCTDGTSTAQACRSCTDGTTTAKVCNSCDDGTTANQCQQCTDSTNSVNQCTTCPDGSTTAKPQCPPPGPRASGPDPCATEQSAFTVADANAHSLQDSLQTLRNTQKAADDAYNAAVLKAAGKYGVAAAFAAASVGSSAIYGIMGWSSASAVPALGAVLVETTVASLGQGLATQAIQYVQNQGLNFADLVDTTKSKDAKQAILLTIQNYLTSQQMQNYSAISPTSDLYDQVNQGVFKNYGPVVKNFGSALTLLSLSGSGTAQSNIEAIGAYDNQVTGDISTQEQQLQNALADLDNARSALNYCRQLHPDSGPTSGS
jgi:hypothetical protein